MSNILPLCSTIHDLDQNSIPDYNFKVFAQTAENLLPDNSQCLQDISLTENNQNILQSWGAPPSTLIAWQAGNYFSSGHRPSCIYGRINRNGQDVTLSESTDTRYTYCTASYRGLVSEELFPTQAICIPDSCVLEIEEIKRTWSEQGSDFSPWFPGNFSHSDWYLNSASNKFSCDPSPEMWCEINHGQPSFKENWDIYNTFSAIIIISTIIFVVLGTFESTTCKLRFLKLFNTSSIKKSWQDLTNHKLNSKEIRSFHSLKVFSMLWIILHNMNFPIISDVYVSYKNQLSDNPLFSAHKFFQAENWPENFGYHFLTSSVAVDTFFTIGGFLVAFLGFKKFRKLNDKRQKLFELITSIILRYFRFIPSVIGTLCLIYMLNFTPEANSILSATYLNLRTLCMDNSKMNTSFWGMLTFLSVWSDSLYFKCGVWFWYVQADFWMYCLGVSILFLLTQVSIYLKHLGHVFLALAILFPVIYKFTISYLCPREPLSLADVVSYEFENNEKMINFADYTEICDDTYATDLYYKPYARMSSYFLGFLFGYVLALKQEKEQSSSFQFRIPRSKRLINWKLAAYVFCWALTSGMLIFLVFLPYIYHHNPNWSRFTLAFYQSILRESWSILIIVLIILIEKVDLSTFSRTCKFLNFPKWLLQHKLWLIPSRLNYTTYCVHTIIAEWAVGQNPNVRFYTGKDIIVYGFSVVSMSYLVAFVFYLFFEAPFARLVDRTLKVKFQKFLGK